MSGCGAAMTKPEADTVALTSLVAFLNNNDPRPPSSATLSLPGAALFASVGCAACHKPSYRILGSIANASGAILTAFLCSDLLLHDMGPGLADGFEQGSTTGSEFRTAPLWRVSERGHFLHDGRATTILDAILLHGGQATGAVDAFTAPSADDRQAVVDLLNGIQEGGLDDRGFRTAGWEPHVRQLNEALTRGWGFSHARTIRIGINRRLNGSSTRPRLSSVVAPSRGSSPSSPKMTGAGPRLPSISK